jgi:hypothetical protein
VRVVPYLDTRLVCSFCLAIRMISNTVMLLNQNGFSLRRALADTFIVTKRIGRSLNWNLQSSWYAAGFMVRCSLHRTLQSSSAVFILCSLHLKFRLIATPEPLLTDLRMRGVEPLFSLGISSVLSGLVVASNTSHITVGSHQ